MHRASGAASSFRGYSSGGARSVVSEVDDKKLMQEGSGNFMKGESRSGVESPQNYGFTSVVHDADKDDDGNVSMGAETFTSFMGGNRSFPVNGPMDDRRHRLKELDKGDSAMFRGKDDRQQFHLSKDGNFMSVRNDRIQRFALVPPPQEEEQQQGDKQQQQSGGEGEKKEKKATGQKSALDDNKKSDHFIEQKKDLTTVRSGNGYAEVADNRVMGYYKQKDINYYADDNHVQIQFGGMTIWVDSGGCYATQPIVVADPPPIKT